jgi:hypothetical protein
VLDTLHVPLVDDNNDFPLWAFVDSVEKIIVSHVNENSLEFWEEYGTRLDIPIDQKWIQALLSELRWLTVVESCDCLSSLHAPEVLSGHPESSDKVAWEVHSFLVVESAPCFSVELRTQEVYLGTNLLSLLKSKLNFETWFHESKVLWNLKVHLEHQAVGIKLGPEYCSPGRIPQVE